MKNEKCVNMFILGAGASVDYGLPVWSELEGLLLDYLKDYTDCLGSRDLTQRFIEELNKIGPGEKYDTVDRLISVFPHGNDNFPDPTEAIFDAVKEIFQRRVRLNSGGWIEIFLAKNNVQPRLENENSHNPSVFINFNYDTLFLSRVVKSFKEKYERFPERKKWKKLTGREYETEFEGCANDIFHPHGISVLCGKEELKIGLKNFCHPTSNTYRNAQQRVGGTDLSRIKLGVDNAISCHDTQDHFTFAQIKARIKELARSGHGKAEMRLILFGMGPDALEFNLDKIFGGQKFDVRQIYYTCTEEKNVHTYEAYFEKFRATIQRYSDCEELVEKNTFMAFD